MHMVQSAFEATNVFSNQDWVKRPPVLGDNFSSIPLVVFKYRFDCIPILSVFLEIGFETTAINNLVYLIVIVSFRVANKTGNWPLI